MKFNISIILILKIIFTVYGQNEFDINEINTLIWVGNNFNIKWDITNSSTICNNVGITCNVNNSTILKLEIDYNIENGSVILPIESNGTIPQPSGFKFPNITSLILRNKEAKVQIFRYINNLPNLQYLEISNLGNLSDVPVQFLQQCPLLSTFIFDNMSTNPNEASLIFPGTILTNGSPFKKLYIKVSFPDFKWDYINNIEELTLNLNLFAPIILDGNKFKNLKYFDLTSDAKLTIQNVTTLKILNVHCSDISSNKYVIYNSGSMDSINLEKCAYDNDGLQILNTNLTSLEIKGGSLSPTSPIIYPKQLEILKIQKANCLFLPNSTDLPNIRELILTDGFFLYYQIDSGFNKLEKINVTNSLIVGYLPQEFCKIKDNDYSKNNISTIPDCFLCHWSYTSKWFSNNKQNLKPSSNFSCNLQLEKTKFKIDSNGGIINLNGINLGWLNENSTPGLEMTIPNYQFTFNIPPKSENLTSELIQFSINRTVLIEWEYFIYGIKEINFIQDVSDVIANITGDFESDYNITIDGIIYPVTIISTNNIHVILSLKQPEGEIVVKYISNTTSSLSSPPPSFIKIFKRNYPTISSTSIVTSNDKQIILYGRFYNGISALDPIIYIDGQNVTLISFNESMAIIETPSNLDFSKGGLANLTIDDNGYIFYSSKVLFYFKQKSNKCEPECENGGTCFEEKCQCINNYSGPTCQFLSPPTDSYKVVINTTIPSSIYGMSKVDFQFSMVGIQELDFNNQIVSEFNITSWEYQADKMIENLGVGPVYESILENGAIVSVSLFIPTSSIVYQFAGVTMNLGVGQIKVSMNISNWQYQSSLNTLRAIFKSTSTNNIENTKTDQCQTTEGKTSSQNGDFNTIKSFTIVRNGAILYGSFIDRMLSNGRISYSKVEDLGLDPLDSSISFVGINMPQCVECILDPDYSILLDPSTGKNDDCNEKSSKIGWLIPVVIVVPFIVLTALIVTSVVIFKKHFIIARDGKSFKFSSRR